jgi:histone H3/H4
MSELPAAPIARIVKKAGAKRVSEDAIKALRDGLEEYAATIAERSYKIATHSGRKTVMAKDIKLALK